jgi:hypothetical protein
MSSLLTHSIRLPLVLSHSGVDLLNDIRSDGGLENSRESSGGSASGTIGAMNGDGRTSRLKKGLYSISFPNNPFRFRKSNEFRKKYDFLTL